MGADAPLELAALAIAVALVYLAVALRSLPAAFAAFTVLTFFDQLAVPRVFAGLLLVLVWVVAIGTRPGATPLLLRDERLLGAAWMLLGGWFVASATWAPDADAALAALARLSQNLAVVLVVYTAVSARHHVRLVASAFVAGVAASAILGVLGGAAGEGRITGGFDDPNQLAAVIVPALVIAFFCFLALRGRGLRWLFLPAAVFLLVALALTGSQGGLVSLAVAVAASIALGGSARRSLLAVAGAGALALLAFSAVAGPPNLTEGGDSRLDLWEVAAHVSADHPLLGVGAGNFEVVEPAYATTSLDLPRADLVRRALPVHNTYLHVLVEYGPVGLLLLLACIGGSLLAGLRAARRFAADGDREMELLARGIVAGSIGMFTAFTFISAQYQKQLWLMLGLAAALASVAQRSTVSPLPQPAVPSRRSRS